MSEIDEILAPTKPDFNGLFLLKDHEGSQHAINRIIGDALAIKSNELSILRNVSRDDQVTLGVGLYVYREGLPVDVCIHAIRSFVPLDLKLRDFRFDLNTLSFSVLNENQTIQISLAILAGKIAAVEESYCWSRAGLFQSLLKSDNLEWYGFKLNDKESGFKSLETWTKKAAGWNNWQERSGYVAFVKSAITDLLSRIIPPELRFESESWTIAEMDASVPSYLADNEQFDKFHCSQEIADAVRRAEGITAILEQKERETLEPNWLFKEELKNEQQQLTDWTSSPDLIRSVKRSLSKRIGAVFDKEYCDEDSNFSEDSWHSSLVDKWTETYEPIYVRPSMTLVFQYGSNCSEEQINSEDRLQGDAAFQAIAETVEDYQLAFDVWSNNRNCAAADIIPTPGSKVWGVLYEIPTWLITRGTARARGRSRSLDAIEGEGTNYRRIEIDVRRSDGEIVTATTYIVIAPKTGLQTNLDYVRHIITGFRERGINPEYIESVKLIAAENNSSIANDVREL